MRSFKTVFCMSCLFLVLFFCASSQAADGIIESVEFQKNSDSSESVIFHMDAPVFPKTFALKGEKPRVVFDFINTQLQRSVPSVVIADGNMVEKIRMGRHTTKTRVVIDMVTAADFTFDQAFNEEKNILTIHIYSAEYPPKVEEPELVTELVEPVAAVEENETAERVEVETVVEETEVVETVQQDMTDDRESVTVETLTEINPLSLEPLLSDVSFENTSNKGEMVLFKLNGFYPPEVSGEENGTPKVSCVFAGTRLGAKVVTDQDVGGEFINKISVLPEAQSGAIRVTLELVSNKNYDLQQVFFKEDNLFVIIVNSYDAPATVVE